MITVERPYPHHSSPTAAYRLTTDGVPCEMNQNNTAAAKLTSRNIYIDVLRPIHLTTIPAQSALIAATDVPNIPDINGNTALHEAAERGLVGLMRKLVLFGADIYAVNVKEKSPLDLLKNSIATSFVIDSPVLHGRKPEQCGSRNKKARQETGFKM